MESLQKRLRQNPYIWVQGLLALVLGAAAMVYESYAGDRLIIFASLYVLWGLMAVFRRRSRGKWYSLFWLVGTLSIVGMELTSRYILNYFLHGFYLLQIIELAFDLKDQKQMTLGGMTLVVSLYKYVELIQYRQSVSAWAELAFFAVVNGMALIVIVLLHRLRLKEVEQKILYADQKRLYEELKQSAAQVERLATVEERNRIAGDLHDTLGHDLTGLIMQLEMAAHMQKVQPEEAGKLVVSASESARAGLTKVRQVVKALQGQDDYDIPVLIETFISRTGVQVDINMDAKIPPSLTQVVYRVIQEALTNAVRHGEASQVQVDVQAQSGDWLEVTIKDNGKAQGPIEKGFGLTNMEQRLTTVGGSLTIDGNESNMDGKGLEVQARIPLGKPDD